MAYWIRESRRITVTKYLVEGNPEDDDFGDNEEYLGYVDVDSHDNCVLGPHGPFATFVDAMNDANSYVDGM